jgi:transcriptional regulator with XRE-family HTH domain
MVESLRRRFGDHVRTLRLARSLTQESLAERADLSVDAIRRIERGAFSPSLETLGKLSSWLQVSLHTLFEQMEPKRGNGVREICDYLENRDRNELKMVWRVVRALFED